MKQFLWRTAPLLVTTALTAMALWVPGSAAAPLTGADLGLQNASLSCSDGTLLQLALSTTELTALTDAVTAINLYPAGDPALACSLAQSTGLSTAGTRSPAASFSDSASALTSGNPNKDYAVGGGQAGPCPSNFSLSAHALADTGTDGVGGTFNYTRQGGPQSTCGAGHLVSKVDCVVVGNDGPGTAQATTFVTHASGAFAVLAGTELRVDVFDSGIPGGAGDMIAATAFDATGPCDFSGYTPALAVNRGNINVHDA
jgi:hypothetical protein